MPTATLKGEPPTTAKAGIPRRAAALFVSTKRSTKASPQTRITRRLEASRHRVYGAEAPQHSGASRVKFRTFGGGPAPWCRPLIEPDGRLQDAVQIVAKPAKQAARQAHDLQLMLAE